MPSERDEIQVSYFVLCDQVITEAGTSKQSLIGVYSALMAEQLPLHANIAVGIGLRVQTAARREILFRFSSPDGALVFSSPPLPCNWDTVESGLRASGFATLQIGLNLRGIPFSRTGVYTAALLCEGSLLATYPVSVLPAMPAAGPPA